MAGEEAVEEAAAAEAKGKKGAPQPAHVADDILLEAAHVLLEGGGAAEIVRDLARSCDGMRDRARSWEIWEVEGRCG